MARIVRTPEARVHVDASGNAAGRGAYVCSPACLAVKNAAKRLSRALKTPISEDAAWQLAQELETAFGGAGKNKE
jgi:hypothetical protein